MVPVVFLLVAAWLLYRTVIDSPKQAITGIALILLGLPVYWYLSKYGRPMENGDTENEEG